MLLCYGMQHHCGWCGVMGCDADGLHTSCIVEGWLGELIVFVSRKHSKQKHKASATIIAFITRMHTSWWPTRQHAIKSELCF
jgi:hypothetical protein